VCTMGIESELTWLKIFRPELFTTGDISEETLIDLLGRKAQLRRLNWKRMGCFRSKFRYPERLWVAQNKYLKVFVYDLGNGWYSIVEIQNVNGKTIWKNEASTLV